MVLLMVLSHIVGQSVLMVCIDEKRLSDKSDPNSVSLMSDDHLILLILLPPVVSRPRMSESG